MNWRFAIDSTWRVVNNVAMKLRDYIDAQRGRAAALARALDINPALISQWASSRGVPSERCIEIERATEGTVRCEELRPDIDWGYLRASASIEPSKEAA